MSWPCDKQIAEFDRSEWRRKLLRISGERTAPDSLLPLTTFNMSSVGLPSDYARMTVNAAVSRTRSYYGLRQYTGQKRTAYPQVAGSQGLGLGVNAYTVAENDGRWFLRCSTGIRGDDVCCRCVSRPNGATAYSLSTVTPSSLRETVMGM